MQQGTNQKYFSLKPLAALLAYALSAPLLAQSTGYFFDSDFSANGTLGNGAAGSQFRSITQQATSTNSTFIIEWNNKFDQWYNTSISYNTEFTLTFQGGGSPPKSNLNSAPTINSYYTLQIDGFSYSNRQAVVMETNNAPQDFTTTGTPVSSPPANVYPGQPLTVTIEMTGPLSPQERIYVRYTDNSFNTSNVVQASLVSGNTTYEATIPAAINTPNANIIYYAYTTTVNANSGSNHDLITLRLSNNGGSNFSYTVEAAVPTVANGNFSDAATWATSSVPTNGTPVEIDHTVELDVDFQTPSFTVNGAGTLNDLGVGNELEISGAGTLTNNGTMSTGGMVLSMINGGTIAGNTFSVEQFRVDGGNLSIANPITVIESMIVEGPSTIDDPVNFGSNATLFYDFSGTHVRGAEWSTTSGAGYPPNVEIQSGTVTTANPSDLSLPLQVANDLDVRSGGALDMANGTGTITVLGDVNFSGSINLSSAIGGDLAVEGHLINNAGGNLNSNNRAIFFQGTNNQDVALDPAVDLLNFVFVDKPSGEVRLTTDATFGANGELEVTNGVLRVTSGHTLDTENRTIDNNDTIIIENDASLIQGTNSNAGTLIGTGVYEVQRSINAADHRRFTYWSSPINSADMNTVFSGTNSNDWHFFDESASVQNWAPVVATTMEPGRGYITTPTVQTSPPTSQGLLPVSETRSFTGTVNNGDITLNFNGAPAAGDYVLLGNPYPSAINGDDVLAAGANALYFWDHTTTTGTNPNQGNNVVADYATYSSAGGVGNNSGTGTQPDQWIASAQGFFAELGSTPPASITFTNAMRSGDNDQFFKKSRKDEREQIWLGLINPNQESNQILLCFTPQASQGFDEGWDARKLQGNAHVSFYSQMPGEQLVIQALPALSAMNYQQELIPLGFYSDAAGNHTIRLDEENGLRAGQYFYLIDSLTGQVTDLRQQAYNFNVAQAGRVDGRFWLGIDNRSIGTIELPSGESPLWEVYQREDRLHVEAAPDIEHWQLLDLAGRSVAADLKLKDEARWRSEPLNIPAGIYILKAENNDGSLRSQRIYWR